MVTLKSIQEIHLMMSYRSIHQLVNSRNGEGVLWTDFVQVRKIHTHSPLPVFLFSHYYVGQPLGVENFLNSSSLLQLVHLYPDCLGMVFG